MVRYHWDEWVFFNMMASILVIMCYYLTIKNNSGADHAHEGCILVIRMLWTLIYARGPSDYALIFHGPPAKTHRLGRVAILKMNVISLCAMVAVRQFVENIWYCFAMIAFTMQIHAMKQVFWLACDFGFSDVFWVASLQLCIAITRELSLRCCMLLLCIVLDYYRYSFYPRPIAPLNLASKKSIRYLDSKINSNLAS